MSADQSDESRHLRDRIHGAAFTALSPWADPEDDDWRDAAADQVADAVLADLSADEDTDFLSDKDTWAAWASVYRSGREDAMEALMHERRAASERLARVRALEAALREIITEANPMSSYTKPDLADIALAALAGSSGQEAS